MSAVTSYGRNMIFKVYARPMRRAAVFGAPKKICRGSGKLKKARAEMAAQ